MKKILLSIFGIFLAFETLVALSYAAFQPTSLGYVTLSFSSMTATAIAQTTAPTVGYPVWCTNCVGGGGSGTPCYSTTTANAQNGFVLSTGTACK